MLSIVVFVFRVCWLGCYTNSLVKFWSRAVEDTVQNENHPKVSVGVFSLLLLETQKNYLFFFLYFVQNQINLAIFEL